MAYHLQNTQEDSFMDMESMTETDGMLRPVREVAQRRTFPTRAVMLAGALLGAAVVCTGAGFALRTPAVKGRSSEAIGLEEESDDDLWNDILGSKAQEQLQTAQKELGTTTEGAEVLETTTTPAPAPAPAMGSAEDLQNAVKAAVPSGWATVSALPTAADLQSAVQAAVPVLPTAVPTPADLQSAVTAAIPSGIPGMPAVMPAVMPSLTDLAATFKNEAAGLSQDDPKVKQLKSIADMLSADAAKTPAVPAFPAIPALPAAPAAPATLSDTTTDDPAKSPLAPQETQGDGNPCPDDEEKLTAICYKKCSMLTGGSHPFRTGPFSCCAEEPCGLGNTWTHPGFCFGYDVAGDSVAKTNGKCPHSPGACLTDEEEHGTLCYKTCSSLTNGAYPHRTAMSSCCKTTGLPCFLPSNSKTDPSFNIGGGEGDNNSGTQAKVHSPSTALTR